jgi:hypothetical protein
MTPFEPREWAFLSIGAGVVTILLGGVASTILVSGGAADLLCIVSVILIADGACLIGCGCKCARLGATLEDQANQIRALSRHLADLPRQESSDPDTQINPAP